VPSAQGRRLTDCQHRVDVSSPYLDVAEIADGSGTVRVVLTLPSWDDYLRTGLDDLIESAAHSAMVLLRARTLLTSLRNAAPPPIDRLAAPAR
jgi:hypothetical protein